MEVLKTGQASVTIGIFEIVKVTARNRNMATK